MWLFGRKRKKKESAPVQGFGEQTESGSLYLEEKTFPEEQKEAAALFNARIHPIEKKEEQEKAVLETVLRVKKNSLDVCT